MTDNEYYQLYGEPRKEREERINAMAALIGVMTNPGFIQIYAEDREKDGDTKKDK